MAAEQRSLAAGPGLGAMRRIVPAGVAAIAVTYGLARYGYGLFVPEIRATFGLSTELLGIIATGSYVLYLGATALVSCIAARTGPRTPVVLGCLCASAGMLLVGISTGPAMLAAGVLIAGAGGGLAYPPFSDAVTQLLPAQHQAGSLAAINSGTSYGVLCAGPIALLASGNWRAAWLAFAALALGAAAWNARVLPRGCIVVERPQLQRIELRWLLQQRSIALLTGAFVVGVGTSVYWTFGVDMVVSEGHLGAGSGQGFLVLIGVAGVIGGLAATMISRFGARRSTWGTVLALAGASGLIAAAPSSLLLVAISAVLFGGSYFLVTAVFGIWSVEVFASRPSAGFGATFFVLAAGQLIGPALSGVIAGQFGLKAAFYAGAALTLLSLPFAPRPRPAGSSVAFADPERLEARP